MDGACNEAPSNVSDTLVPTSTQGTQAWDRYAYGLNNPSRYTDPSGHKACDHFDENGNCVTSSITWIVVCGVDDKVPCADSTNPDSPFGQIRSLMERGDKLIVRDVDACHAEEEAAKVADPHHTVASKANCASEISTYIDNHPSENVVLVGHSAGADVAIMVADRMVNNGQQDQLTGLILFAPPLGFVDGYGFSGLPYDMLENLRNNGVAIYVANGVGNYGNGPTLAGLVDNRYPNYFFDDSLSDVGHMALATDMSYLQSAWNIVLTSPVPFFLISYEWPPIH